MNNGEKKLDALIDALGFDVECELDEESYGRETMSQQARGWNVTVNMADHCQYKLTKRKDAVQRQRELFLAALDEHQAGTTTYEEFMGIVNEKL